MKRLLAPDRGHIVEGLEPRTLLSAALLQPIGNQVFAQDSGTESADLNGVFFDSNGESDLTFAATSSNPAVLSASISGSMLTLTPEQGRSGYAIVQMTAADPGGSKAFDSFRVQITAADARTLHVTLNSGRKSFTYAASNQAAATVTLKGPGTADVLMGGDALKLNKTALFGANQEMESITLSGTTAATSLVISGRGASRFSLNVANISAASGALGMLEVKGATLVGDVSVPDGIHALNVDAARSGSIDAGSSAITIQGKSFIDENFTSTGSVRSLKIGQWASSDTAPETFSAASIGRLSSIGSFTPGLQLTGVLGPSRIGGSIGGTWNVGRATAPLTIHGSIGGDFNGTFGALPGLTVTGAFDGILTAPSLKFLKATSMVEATVNLTAASTSDLGLLAVSGSIGFTSILTAGNIGKLTAAQLSNCRIFAGISSPSLPASAADFSSAASIGSVILKPRRGLATSFDSARIAASRLGVLSLGTTKTSNSGIAYGVGAQSIGQLTVQDTSRPQTIKLLSIHDAATLAAQLSAQKVQLGDLAIQIV